VGGDHDPYLMLGDGALQDLSFDGNTVAALVEPAAAGAGVEADGLVGIAAGQGVRKPLRSVVVLAEDDDTKVDPLFDVQEVGDGRELRVRLDALQTVDEPFERTAFFGRLDG